MTERLSRVKRAETPPPMQLTDRDLRILRLITAFRYATREQIERLEFTPTTVSYCKRRLTLLYHNAYIDRLFLPLRGAFGAARAYYVLDQRGAQLVAHAMELPRSELDWRPRDGRREPLYMEHTLRINDVRALLVVAARIAALELHWIDERELKRRAHAFRVPDPLDTSQLITIIPDGYFTLGTAAFALELDRGTVEEGPFKRKVRGYGAWKTTGGYGKAFGTESLRVLFVVADAKRDPHRLTRIKAWAEAAQAGSLFWFADFDDLAPETVLEEPLWSVAARPTLSRLRVGGSHDLGDLRGQR